MRALTQWLALAPLFVIAGCSTLQQSPRLASSESVLSLSVADSNLGEALAHYSQGLIDEATLGTSQSAFLHFKQAADLDSTYIPLNLKVAAEAIGRKDYPGAISILKSLERAHPDSFEIRLLLGSVYQAQGDRDAAVRCFNLAIRMAPDRSEGYLRLATLRVLELDSQKTMAVVREGFRHVKDPLPLVEFCENGGRLFIAGKDIQGAIPFFEQILGVKPEDDTIREALARCYVVVGEERKALAALKLLQTRNPENPKIAFSIGELYELLGDSEKALGSYNLASKYDARNMSLVLRKANLEMQRDINLALSTLEDAVQQFPDDVRVRVYLALLYMQIDKHAEAVKQFDQVARNVEQNESARLQLQPLYYFWYGSSCERVGRFEEGEQHFSRYLAANPDSAETLNYLAFMWAERGIKLEQADAYIAKALNQEPDNGAYLDTKGWIQYKRGDYSNAFKSLKLALRKAGEDPEIMNHLGDTCAALNKPRQAIAWWLKSLKMAPENISVREKLIKAGVDAKRLSH